MFSVIMLAEWHFRTNSFLVRGRRICSSPH